MGQNLDLWLLRVALFGTLIIGFSILLPSMMTTNEQLTKSPTPHIDVSCWTPTYFTSFQVQVAEESCLVNFYKYLENASYAGVDVDSDTLEEIQLTKARAVLTGQAEDGRDDVDPAGERSGRKGVKSLHIFVLLQLGMSVVVYAAASWARHLALRSGIRACVKTLEVTSLKTSPENDAEVSDQDSLLDHVQDVPTAVVKSLHASHALGLTYLILHLTAICFWISLAMVHCYTAYQMTTVTPARPENHEVAGAGVDEVGGTFTCKFDIRDAGSVQRFTVYCLFAASMQEYRLSQTGNESDVNEVGLQQVWSNAALCLTLCVLHLIYTLHFFLFSVQSRRSRMQTVLQHAVITTSRCPPFAISDLYVAHALTEQENTLQTIKKPPIA